MKANAWRNIVFVMMVIITFQTSAWAASTLPDGDLLGDGVTIADAMRALKIAVGLVTPLASDFAHGDIAPLNNGYPTQDGKIDTADALLILRKVVGLATWATMLETSVKLTTATSLAASSPSLSIAKDGKAIAVWSEGVYPSRILWISRYEPNVGWGTPQSVGTGIGDEGDAKVAVNASGLAVLVWRRDRNNSREILAANYDPTKGWSVPSILDSSGLGIAPDVTLDDSGNAIAIWNLYDIVNYKNTGMTSRYTSSGWDVPQILQPNASAPVQKISGNSSGKAIAIWNQSDPVLGQFEHKYNTWVRQFEPGIGWSTPQPVGNDILEINGAMYLNADSVPGHYNSMIAVDGQGNALALWSEVSFAGDSSHTTFNRLEVGKGWGAPQLLDNLGLPSDKIVFNDSGSAYFSWTENVKQSSNTSYLSTLSVATYSTANGWAKENLFDKYPYYCFNSSIIIGKDGNPLVTWLQSSGYDSQLWFKNYSPTTGWSSPIRLDSNTGEVDEYHIANDAAGNVTVIWTQYSGTNRVMWSKLVN
jgi:hypothetical protein